MTRRSLILLGLALGLPACNSLLGLDDDAGDDDASSSSSGGSASGATSASSSSSGAGSSSSSGASSSSGVTGASSGVGSSGAGSVGTVYPAWTRWTVSAGLPGAPRVDPLTEITTDAHTELQWSPDVGRELIDEAERACGRLELGDADDWRLPTRIELLSLVDYTAEDAVERIYIAVGPENGWSVDVGRGFANPASRSSGAVRCVRGGRTLDNGPAARFSLAEGGAAVHDQITSLTWKKRPSLTQVLYADAAGQCAAPYRLPTVHELQSIVDDSGVSPALAAPFEGEIDYEWTSSAVRLAGAQGAQWIVYFGDGKARPHTGTYARVRCVK